MDNENKDLLLVDEKMRPILIEAECVDTQAIIKDFVNCYAENKDKPTEKWLEPKLQEYLGKISGRYSMYGKGNYICSRSGGREEKFFGQGNRKWQE